MPNPAGLRFWTQSFIKLTKQSVFLTADAASVLRCISGLFLFIRLAGSFTLTRTQLQPHYCWERVKSTSIIVLGSRLSPCAPQISLLLHIRYYLHEIWKTIHFVTDESYYFSDKLIVMRYKMSANWEKSPSVSQSPNWCP